MTIKNNIAELIIVNREKNDVLLAGRDNHAREFSENEYGGMKYQIGAIGFSIFEAN